jgi:hypothetical protein
MISPAPATLEAMVQRSVHGSSKNCDAVLIGSEDGTATWSLTTLQRSLREAPDGLPEVSTFTILHTIHEAGYTWQKNRTWCKTGFTLHKTKDGVEERYDPYTEEKKLVIERAYMTAERLGLQLWCEDEGGPYQAIPQPGQSWQPEGHPARQPHEYVRGRTAKLLTLFRPATGQVRGEAAEQTTNAILHPWLKRELEAILEQCPPEPDIVGEWVPLSNRDLLDRGHQFGEARRRRICMFLLYYPMAST